MSANINQKLIPPGINFKKYIQAGAEIKKKQIIALKNLSLNNSQRNIFSALIQEANRKLFVLKGILNLEPNINTPGIKLGKPNSWLQSIFGDRPKERLFTLNNSNIIYSDYNNQIRGYIPLSTIININLENTTLSMPSTTGRTWVITFKNEAQAKKWNFYLKHNINFIKKLKDTVNRESYKAELLKIQNIYKINASFQEKLNGIMMKSSSDNKNYEEELNRLMNRVK